MGAAGTSNTAALVFGGHLGSFSALTEGYDGTSWSTRPSLGTARSRLANGPIGTQTLALAAGGHTPTIVAATEEFTGETTAANVKTFTTS